MAYYTELGYTSMSWSIEKLEDVDVAILVAGRCKINSWFWVLICEEKEDVPAGPALNLDCQKCNLKSFRERLLLGWMKTSLKTLEVIGYLRDSAVRVSRGVTGPVMK
ncbi:hypothetical protein PTI98_011675 [Pleurotus ostreatus]|nr:hypothetical protein PTI98_011675 [Pleurotus ostreatus]